MVTEVRARLAEPADHAAFRDLLARGWPGSNGYHSSVLERWASEWPTILKEFEAFLVIETDAAIAGYAGVQRHEIAYTGGLKRALIDHFLAPGLRPELAIATVVPAVGAWARDHGFARVTTNMEPQEESQFAALRAIGGFPERVAMFTERFPDGPFDPGVRLMRSNEWDIVTAMGAQIAEDLSHYPGALPSPSFPELVGLTERAYREYGETRPHAFFVAERSGQVVGFVFAVIEGPDGGLIYDLFVAPDYRRQGISRSLYRTATAWLAEHGARWLTLSVFADNRPALAAYEQWGFFPYFVAWEYNL